VDHVVEVGGAGTLQQSIKSTAACGRISIIGVLSGVGTEIMLTPILMSGLQLQGILVGHRAGFEALCAFLTEHELRPVISHSFGLDEVREGFELMGRGGHFGKIAIRV